MISRYTTNSKTLQSLEKIHSDKIIYEIYNKWILCSNNAFLYQNIFTPCPSPIWKTFLPFSNHEFLQFCVTYLSAFWGYDWHDLCVHEVQIDQSVCSPFFRKLHLIKVEPITFDLLGNTKLFFTLYIKAFHACMAKNCWTFTQFLI